MGVPVGGLLPANGLPAESDERRMDLGTTTYAKQRCAETAERAGALLAKVAELPTSASPHQPAVQVAALLLRLCGGGKVTHLLRCNPPDTVAEPARSFDTALLKAYETLADLDPLSADQKVQCQLPLRLGGRGLRSQERLAPAAWTASWAACLPEVLNRTGLTCLEDLATCQLPLAAACREAAAALFPPQVGNAGENTGELHWRAMALELRLPGALRISNQGKSEK